MSTATLAVLASGAAGAAVQRHLPTLVTDRVASRLFEQDATLWGDAAEAEAEIRLSWVDLPRRSRPLLGEVEALRGELEEAGVRHIVLCGMGGSSLAPEVICATAGVELSVLDSSCPQMVRTALGDRLERTAVVVSSKSGSTVETDSQRRAFIEAFTRAGIDPAERIIVVTDPASPLDAQSRADGYRVVNADPDVGGRYSALTAFGLVPSGLAGADIEQLLDEAESVADLLAADDEANPALRLGAALGGTTPLRNKLLVVDEGSQIPGFGGWAEQLGAESTGKEGTGVLPVVVGPGREPDPDVASATDVTVVRLVPDLEDDEYPPQDTATQQDATQDPGPGRADDGSVVTVSGSLGAQLLLWESATAVAGRLLGINPFDQPDVESAKEAARALMEQSTNTPDEPAFTDGAVEVRALGGGWLDPARAAGTVESALDALLGQLDPQHGYLAVMVYLDRWADADLAPVRDHLAERCGRPVTFGWGPRFLHSTGQFHKGGSPEGVYLQVTGAWAPDLAVPGREFTFGSLIAAQAAGDAAVLAGKGRPILRLHLTDHDRGLAQLRSAIGIPRAGGREWAAAARRR